MSSPLYRLFADRIGNTFYEGSIRLPTIRCIAIAFPLLLYRGFRCIETGAILLFSTEPNVAGETCLANPLRRSGFQAARHNIIEEVWD
jgi:hypothetical protein